MSTINNIKYYPEFITESEEQQLIEFINQQTWDTTLKRRTQHYGWRYPYFSKDKLEKTQDIPKELYPILEKINNKFNKKFDQIIINEYLPGQGIAPHIDHKKLFGDTIISLSLGSTCIMRFEDDETDNLINNLLLERRSIVCLQEEYRYKYSHSIPARKSDLVDGKKFERQTRISLTFRIKI